jgi:hypothetical protein
MSVDGSKSMPEVRELQTIQCQRIDGRPARRRSANYVTEGFIPNKMSVPVVTSGMKQRDDQSCGGIGRFDDRVFPSVATAARERQIREVAVATARTRSDMIDGKGRTEKLCGARRCSQRPEPSPRPPS